MKKPIYLFCILAFMSFCTKKKDPSDQGKKQFRFSRSSDPKSMDPQAQFDSESSLFVSATYDTLLSYHYLKRPYELVPKLLEKMPEKKDDLTYILTLRSDVVFQDDPCFEGGKGRTLHAEDVIYTFKRFADINVNTKSWFFLEKVIKGLDGFRDETKKQTKINYDSYSVDGLKKIDDLRIEITLNQKNPLFLYALAVTSLSIVAKEAVEKYGDQFDFHPVGTGPFRLEEYRKKQTVTLIKNPNYFGTYPLDGDDQLLADKGKKLPLLDEVKLDFIPEPQPGMLKFLDGDLDWVALDRDNFLKMAKKQTDGSFILMPEWKDRFVIYSEPTLSVSYFLFNMKDSLVGGTNKLLRQALAYAINTEEEIDLLANGRGEKLYSLLPLGIEGSERQIGKDYGIPYNLEKAKELLKQAGYSDTKKVPPIKLTMSNNTSAAQKSYEFLRENLSKIGVTLEVEYKTWSTYLQDIESGNFQMASSAWAADYPDGENFYQLFYGPNKAPGSNNSGFDHKEFNALYEEIRFMENSPERNKKIAQMAAILKEESPAIVSYNPTVVGLLQKNVKNFKRHMMLSNPFEYLNLD
jgi:oligopeptide transport system substrate-binding protein